MPILRAALKPKRSPKSHYIMLKIRLEWKLRRKDQPQRLCAQGAFPGSWARLGGRHLHCRPPCNVSRENLVCDTRAGATTLTLTILWPFLYRLNLSKS